MGGLSSQKDPPAQAGLFRASLLPLQSFLGDGEGRAAVVFASFF